MHQTKESLMKKRITIVAALVAATMTAGMIPAFAAGTGAPNAERPARPHRAERVRPERTGPPEWIDQTADEVRAELAERSAKIEERITEAKRLTDEQKAAAIERLDATLDAVADLDEPAEVIGTTISRRQLARIEFRATRNGETPDYDAHIAGDVKRFSLRLEHLTKIAGWADAAGENVTAVTGYLDNASALLEIAGGTGTVEKRHDAAHIARAWMTEANVALMSM
jgi:hypothetical protein